MKYKAVICVCGSPRVQKNKAGDRFWVQDCSAATENILLAATALGLGSVWIGVYPVTIYVRQVRSILNIPDDVTPLGLIGLGYPAEPKTLALNTKNRASTGSFIRLILKNGCICSSIEKMRKYLKTPRRTNAF
jgi:nitroreductase